MSGVIAHCHFCGFPCGPTTHPNKVKSSWKGTRIALLVLIVLLYLLPISPSPSAVFVPQQTPHGRIMTTNGPSGRGTSSSSIGDADLAQVSLPFPVLFLFSNRARQSRVDFSRTLTHAFVLHYSRHSKIWLSEFHRSNLSGNSGCGVPAAKGTGPFLAL